MDSTGSLNVVETCRHNIHASARSFPFFRFSRIRIYISFGSERVRRVAILFDWPHELVLQSLRGGLKKRSRLWGVEKRGRMRLNTYLTWSDPLFDLNQEPHLFWSTRKGTYPVFCFLDRTDQLPPDRYRVVGSKEPVTTPEHPPIPRDRSSSPRRELCCYELAAGEAEQTTVTRAFQTKDYRYSEQYTIAQYSNRGHCLGQTLADIPLLRLERTTNGESYDLGVDGMKVKTRISRPSPSIMSTFHPHRS